MVLASSASAIIFTLTKVDQPLANSTEFLMLPNDLYRSPGWDEIPPVCRLTRLICLPARRCRLIRHETELAHGFMPHHSAHPRREFGCPGLRFGQRQAVLHAGAFVAHLSEPGIGQQTVLLVDEPQNFEARAKGVGTRKPSQVDADG